MKRRSDIPGSRIKQTPFRLKNMTGLVLALTFMMQGFPRAETQEQLLKVGVRMADVSLNKLAFVVAYEEGIYRKNGLEVEQFITPGAAEVARANGVKIAEKFILKENAPTLPISIGGCCPTIVNLTTVAGEKDPVIIACTDQLVRTHIVSRPDITCPEQLKGKRLGYASYGTVTHMVAISFCEAMGWNPNQDLSLMSGANTVEALQKGYVDAFVASELHETMAVAAGFKDLVDLSKYKMPNAGSGVIVNRAWLKENQEAARRFIKSAVDALALVKQDKNVAFNAMAKWYGIKDPELQEYFFRKTAYLPRKPYPPVEGIKKVMKIYDSHEMRKYRPESFYDASFVHQLDKSGYIDSLYK